MVGIRLDAKKLDSYQATSKSNIEAATTSVDMKVEDFDSNEEVGIEEVEF